MIRVILAVFSAVLILAAAIGFARYRAIFSFPAAAFAIFRWIAILPIVGYAAKRKSLTLWVFAGLAAGVEFGHDLPALALHLQFLGVIFLRLVKMIIAPLLFSTLVVGIAGHTNLRSVGRIGIKALLYFEVVSTLALIVGFVGIDISNAGAGVAVPHSPVPMEFNSTPHSIADLIVNIFPENIAKSVSDGQILQIVIFSILFGAALALVPEERRRALVSFSASLSEAMLKLTSVVMFAAPIGVFGTMAYTVGHLGIGILLPLLKLLGTMYATLIAFVLAVFLPIALFARVPLRRFLKAVADPVTIAFTTASSEAALPCAMERLEGMGVSRETVSLVLPTGYSFNLDGSSLYQSVALVFVAQVAGVHLGFTQQIAMLLTLLVSSKGTAGVARASLIVVMGAAASFHLPSEAVFLLFGIDQLMDMPRSAVNVLGNCLATVVIARSENVCPGP